MDKDNLLSINGIFSHIHVHALHFNKKYKTVEEFHEAIPTVEAFHKDFLDDLCGIFPELKIVTVFQVRKALEFIESVSSDTFHEKIKMLLIVQHNI